MVNQKGNIAAGMPHLGAFPERIKRMKLFALYLIDLPWFNVDLLHKLYINFLQDRFANEKESKEEHYNKRAITCADILQSPQTERIGYNTYILKEDFKFQLKASQNLDRTESKKLGQFLYAYSFYCRPHILSISYLESLKIQAGILTNPNAEARRIAQHIAGEINSASARGQLAPSAKYYLNLLNQNELSPAMAEIKSLLDGVQNYLDDKNEEAIKAWENIEAREKDNQSEVFKIKLPREVQNTIVETLKKKRQDQTQEQEQEQAQIGTIYALFVGIDKYEGAIAPLQGCFRDIIDIQEYFYTQQKETYELNTKQLANSSATKEAIIEAFSHFEAATENDLCLFYFAGLGSTWGLPPGLSIDRSDSVRNALVCYDSRTGRGDLLDVELNYMIANIQKRRKIPFISILDCGFNTGNVRPSDESIQRGRRRSIDPIPGPVNEENIFGFQEWRRSKIGFELPTPRDYITIEGGRRLEEVLEVPIGNQFRGLLSYHLCSLLRFAKDNFTYSSLAQTLEFRFKAIGSTQTPTIFYSSTSLAEENIFNNLFTAYTFQVSFDTNKSQWILNAGIQQGLNDESLIFELHEVPSVELKITEVGEDFAVVEGLETLNPAETYTAKVKKQLPERPKIFFAFDTESDPFPQSYFNGYFEELKADFPLITFTERLEEAAYIMHVQEQSFELSLPGNTLSLFERSNTDLASLCQIFLNDLNTVAFRDTLQAFENKDAEIKPEEYEISLLYQTSPDVSDDEALVVPQAPASTYSLPYYSLAYGTEYEPPIFQIKVSNTGERPFHVSALYLPLDFGIDNRFLPDTLLNPGESVFLTEQNNDILYQKIILDLPDTFIDEGINQIREQFLFILSQDRINSAALNMESLDLNLDMPPRSRASSSNQARSKIAGWRTEKMELVVFRPPLAGAIHDKSPVFNYKNLKLEVVNNFSAQVRWVSQLLMQEALNIESFKTTEQIWGKALEVSYLGHNIKKFDLMGFNMLSIENTDNADLVHADNPLLLSTSISLEENEIIIPIAYDQDQEKYIPLGMSDRAGEISIETLPISGQNRFAMEQATTAIAFHRIRLEKAFSEKQEQGLFSIPIVSNYANEAFQEQEVEEWERTRLEKVLIIVPGMVLQDGEQIAREIFHYLEKENIEVNKAVDQGYHFKYDFLHTPLDQAAELLQKALHQIDLIREKEVTILAHSTGGLVARWMIEILGGAEIVDQLILLGTPNGGWVWDSLYQVQSILLGKLLNEENYSKKHLPQLLWEHMLGFANPETKTAIIVRENTNFIRTLNDSGADPGIPYTIIAGAIRPDEKNSAFMKLYERFKARDNYEDLLALQQRLSSDYIVSSEKAFDLPASKAWKQVPQRFTVNTHHLGYFESEECLEIIGEVLSEGAEVEEPETLNIRQIRELVKENRMRDVFDLLNNFFSSTKDFEELRNEFLNLSAQWARLEMTLSRDSAYRSSNIEITRSLLKLIESLEE